MTRFCIAALLLALCGCVAQPAGQLIALDAQNAATMAAKASFDPGAPLRIPCWNAWATLGGSLQGSGTGGIMTTTETSLEAQAAFSLPACQAIEAQILISIARRFGAP